MREIKFRGKRIDNGEWVCGVPVVTSISGAYMVSAKAKSKGGKGGIVVRDVVVQHEVDPATIGQYTGLKDKNGTEIYEGDIVSPSNSWNPELKFVVTFGEGVFDSGYYSFTGFYLISDDGRQGEDQYELSKDSVYEIIGNIHDNPELLGGAG